jgi:iron-sulfur cluster assembly accessory protein
MYWKGLNLTLLLALIQWTSSFVIPSGSGIQRLQYLQSAPSETVEEEVDFEGPEDAVVMIKPKAMNRLRELKEKEKKDGLILRMGVRNGGCSGLSYIMDFSTEDAIEEDDLIDYYPGENIKCVVDAKSMLYLYGLELDYSDELIGGG